MSKLDFFSFATEPVAIGNGNTAHIRRISAAERAAWLAQVDEGDSNRDALAKLLVYCIADETGKRRFDDGEHALVAGIDAQVFDTMGKLAMAINGFSADAKDEAKKK